MTKFKIEQAMSLSAIRNVLAAELPEYDVTVKHTFVEYVEVKYSSFVGVWIRMKKNQVWIFGVVPSAIARFAFGPALIPSTIPGKDARGQAWTGVLHRSEHGDQRVSSWRHLREAREDCVGLPPRPARSSVLVGTMAAWREQCDELH